MKDTEQRELYEAAKCIQKAYRSYKGRQKIEEQNKERSAAVVIQNYYRRYKQFAYYRQITNAALVIQQRYRSYRRYKRLKKFEDSYQTTNIDVASNACSLSSSSNSSSNSIEANSHLTTENIIKKSEQMNTNAKFHNYSTIKEVVTCSSSPLK